MSKTFADLPPDYVRSRYIFFDNDFLNHIFKDESFFVNATRHLSGSEKMLDPLTVFEFNRDVLSPVAVEKRNSFLSAGLFFPVMNHSSVYSKIIRNALLLSKLYKKKGCKADNSIDLLLAGRIMYMRSSNPLLLTGNKKHFPSFIFTTIGVICNEDSLDGSLKTYSVLEFDLSKFQTEFAELQKIPQYTSATTNGTALFTFDRKSQSAN